LLRTGHVLPEDVLPQALPDLSSEDLLPQGLLLRAGDLRSLRPGLLRSAQVLRTSLRSGLLCAQHLLPEDVLPQALPHLPSEDVLPQELLLRAGHLLRSLRPSLLRSAQVLRTSLRSGLLCAQHLLPEDVLPQALPHLPSEDVLPQELLLRAGLLHPLCTGLLRSLRQIAMGVAPIPSRSVP
jgi:hypothetical protein